MLYSLLCIPDSFQLLTFQACCSNDKDGNTKALESKSIMIMGSGSKSKSVQTCMSKFYQCMKSIPEDIIQLNVPVLALLGDIGLAHTTLLPRDFLFQQADHFEHILYLTGNHEFYNDRNKHNCYTVQLCSNWIGFVQCATNVLIFISWNAISLKINGVIVLRMALWSFVSKKKTKREGTEMSMNDYCFCYKKAHHTAPKKDTLDQPPVTNPKSESLLFKITTMSSSAMLSG